MARSRLDVKQAAQVLGISTDAVHKRAKRGTLASEKDEDGRIFVWLDTEDNGYTSSSQDVQPLLMARLENENEFLRQELERRADELSEMRRIVAGLVQRVPELEPTREASSDERESPERDAGSKFEETPFTEEERPSAERPSAERPSRWRKFFGFE